MQRALGHCPFDDVTFNNSDHTAVVPRAVSSRRWLSSGVYIASSIASGAFPETPPPTAMLLGFSTLSSFNEFVTKPLAPGPSTVFLPGWVVASMGASASGPIVPRSTGSPARPWVHMAYILSRVASVCKASPRCAYAAEKGRGGHECVGQVQGFCVSPLPMV